MQDASAAHLGRGAKTREFSMVNKYGVKPTNEVTNVVIYVW